MVDNYWNDPVTYDPALMAKVTALVAKGIPHGEAVKMVQGGNTSNDSVEASGNDGVATNGMLDPWFSWVTGQYNKLFPTEYKPPQANYVPAFDAMGRQPLGDPEPAQSAYVPAFDGMGGQPLGDPNPNQQGFVPAFDGMIGQVSPVPAAPAVIDVSPTTIPKGVGTDSALGRLLAKQARLNRDKGNNLGQVTSGSNLAGLAHLFNSYVRGKDDRQRSAELENVDREVYEKRAEQQRQEAARREALARQQRYEAGRGKLRYGN